MEVNVATKKCHTHTQEARTDNTHAFEEKIKMVVVVCRDNGGVKEQIVVVVIVVEHAQSKGSRQRPSSFSRNTYT